ncbi:sensor histidine kinase KdpD [Actinomyces sp.]|uniref:sensor histidine kinase n=1 Tax=Actinomyces sp. TaxID=29317 RepID=UPI0026DDC840|nr:HAMP domain-containing sensor histidine kinase [Actinomyces sp.]MDO4899739.1 HAMP domain-containing sensor histidine kinase [Actinomyces sp.]
MRGFWLGWAGGVVVAAALTVLAHLLWRELTISLSAPVPVTVGMVSAVPLTVALLAAIAQRRRRVAEQRLRVAVQEEARARHRQFLQRLDHELKNPLTAVRAAVADASRSAAPAVAADLEVVDAQSRRMSRLLTDLRKLSELETAPLALEEVDLAETVQDAVSAVIEEAAGRGAAVRVRLDLPAAPWPLPHVRGDGDLLYSAVYNVISNAAKYTPGGGAVEVRGREDTGAITIEVADTGIGVPEADLNRVFNELERAANARVLPGSGLGLALVRTIIARHGGHVRMTSREGVGTRVWLTLPITGPPRAAHPARAPTPGSPPHT